MFQKIHKLILYTGGGLSFHVFPLYITYFCGDKVVALLYFRGKFVDADTLVLGLNLESKPSKDLGFKDDKHMKHPNINYSIIFKNPSAINQNVSRLIKSISCRH